MGEAGRECVQQRRRCCEGAHGDARIFSGNERSDAFNEAVAGERGVVRLGVGGRAHDKYIVGAGVATPGGSRDRTQPRSGPVAPECQ